MRYPILNTMDLGDIMGIQWEYHGHNTILHMGNERIEILVRVPVGGFTKNVTIPLTNHDWGC